MSKPLRITPAQTTTAMSIIFNLADAAMEGGKAAELRLGRLVVDEIVKLAEEVKRNG